jgi:protein subunit release factor A
LEVRAGTGGREAQLFAAEIFEMYKQVRVRERERKKKMKE